MQPVYLANATVVTPEETAPGAAVLMERGRIAAVGAGAPPGGCDELDLNGAWLLPGLVDLHCDAIEKIAEPRVGVRFDFGHAAQAADALSATCGITTSFNAISFAGDELGLRNERAGRELVRAIIAGRPHTTTNQRVHARLEVSSSTASAAIGELLEDAACDLVSLMDHFPGQGQFVEEAAYRDFHRRNYGRADEEIDAVLKQKQEARRHADEAIAAIAEQAQSRNVPLAGHDLDSPEAVRSLHARGVSICEFPMTAAAAGACRDASMSVLVGASNVMRGGSQGSGLAALELIGGGLADCLCSDYMPSTLLPAVFTVAERLGVPLHQAAAMATLAPAAAAGLHDRGAIAVGRRADLIAVRRTADHFRVERMWVAGREVYTRQPHGQQEGSIASAG